MSGSSGNAVSLTTRLAVWLATGLGLGMVTPAPGTIGGLWGLPLAWVVYNFPSVGAQAVSTGVFLLVSVLVCDRAASYLARKDPQEVVLDEIAVLPMVFLWTGLANWKQLLVGWVLFRFFDIWKPIPIRQVEKLPGGWGIVADDALAACYAAVALKLLLWLTRASGWEFLAS